MSKDKSPVRGVRSLRHSRKIGLFRTLNALFLLMLALSCFLPFLHVLSVSLSDTASVITGKVGIWPKGFNLSNYQFVLSSPSFIKSFFNSVKRVALGTFLNLLFAVLGAYPLSKEKEDFRGRTVFAWFYFVTMIVNGGLIPRFLIVDRTGLMDTIWALILPGAVNAFFIVILLNFFRNIPTEQEDSAFMDGAGHFCILFRIYLPQVLPALAALFIYSAMQHWNEFLDGMIFMSDMRSYPLSTYLRNIIVKSGYEVMNAAGLVQDEKLSYRAFAAAQMVVSAIPVLLILPFIQRFFIIGIIPGKIKD